MGIGHRPFDEFQSFHLSYHNMEEIKIGIDRKTYRLKEESLARKRNQEYHKQLFWNDITNYYKTWDAQATKYNTWLSYPQSAASTRHRDENELQFYKQRLQERRSRLQNLLTEEFRQYENELFQQTRKNCKSYNASMPSQSLLKDSPNSEANFSDSDINCRRPSPLHTQRIRKKLQNVVLTDDSSYVLDKNKVQESMNKCWTQQMKEKQMQKEYERKLALRLEEENAKKRLLDEELQREMNMKKKEEMKKLQNYLLSQMEEVKKRDELTQKIKLQEQQDIKLKAELEKIAVQRNQIEKQRRSRELYSFLRHQYQLQLKQKTKQIQQELNEDGRLIEEIIRCFEQEQIADNRAREETRKELDRANAILNEFSRLEKQREKEMEFLFFEEARKLWQKQEKKWNAEQEARNNLMRDVLVTIQKQIKEKLQQHADEHARLLEEKEQFLKQIESVNAQLKEKEAEMKLKKEKYREELEKQISEKRSMTEKQENRDFLDEEYSADRLKN